MKFSPLEIDVMEQLYKKNKYPTPKTNLDLGMLFTQTPLLIPISR